MRFSKFFVALIVMIQIAPAWALSSDSKQPLHLIADSAKMNNATGVSVYTGNVKVTQGSMELLGNVVTVYSEGNKIMKVVSTGDKKKQAYYTEQQDNNAGPIKAWGDTITYNASSQTVDLKRNAKVTRPSEVFTGEFIEYNRASKTVNAKSSNGSGKRVQIIIQPKNGSSSSTPKK